MLSMGVIVVPGGGFRLYRLRHGSPPPSPGDGSSLDKRVTGSNRIRCKRRDKSGLTTGADKIPARKMHLMFPFLCGRRKDPRLAGEPRAQPRVARRCADLLPEHGCPGSTDLLDKRPRVSPSATQYQGWHREPQHRKRVSVRPSAETDIGIRPLWVQKRMRAYSP